MKQKLLLALLALFTLGGSNLFAQTDVTSTYITNADFSSTDGWTTYASSQFHSEGNGLIGTFVVTNSYTSTTDDTHLDTEYCLGVQCRWQTNFVAYQQTKEEVTLPAGVYTLTYDVENTNTATTAGTSENYDNLFYVKVGETTYSDTSTEWMSGSSDWTTHTINFTVEEATSANFMISLGYGLKNGSNWSSANTPHIYISHLAVNYTALTVPTDVALSESTLALNPTAMATLTANITPSDANYQTDITWTTSDATVATVADGVVTAVGAGTATITATTANGVSATCAVTVTDVTPVAAPSFYSEIAAGDFYIVNAATGKAIGTIKEGWGTQAGLPDHGIPFTVALGDGVYTLDSHTYNSADAHFFTGTFVDGTSTNLYINSLGDGKYSISTADGSAFVTANVNDIVVANTAPTANSVLAQWYFVSKDNLESAMAAATTANPVDATFYIQDPDFSRNHIIQLVQNGQATKNPGNETYLWKYTASNYHFKGGENGNMCAETYQNGGGKIYQELTGIKNGRYVLKAQAFHNGSGVTSLYANDESIEVAVLNANGEGTAASMSGASAAFSAGQYQNELEVFVTDGNLTIGIENVSTNWACFDNFELYYLGPTVAGEAVELTDPMEAGKWYYLDLSVDGTYNLTAETLSDIVYTNDGTVLIENEETVTTQFAGAENQQLTAGRYYVKSSSEQTFTIAPASYDYNLGEVVLSTADGGYTQSSTFTVTFPNAATNDPAAAVLSLVDNSKATVNGTEVALTAVEKGFTFELGTIAANTEFVIAIPAAVYGYADHSMNEAINITIHTPAVLDGFYFLRTSAGKYVARGGDYNSRAVVDEFGLPLSVATDASGITQFTYVDNGGKLFLNDQGNAYTDANTDPNWIFEATEGGYYIVHADGTYANKKLNVWSGDNKSLFATGTEGTVFVIEPVSEHNTYMEALKDAQAAVAAAALGNEEITTKADLATWLNENYSATSVAVDDVTFTEKWNGNASAEWGAGKDMYTATVTDLPEGLYKLTVNAYYRLNGSATAAEGARANVYLYGNDVKTQLYSLKDFPAAEAWPGRNQSDADGYYPDDFESGTAATTADNYLTELYVYISDGTLNYGIHQPSRFSNGQWFGFQNFTLTRYDAPASITIKAGRQYTAFSYDKALDFSGSELTAQIVTSAKGTSETVTKVPANTGIIVGLAEATTEATTISVPVYSGSDFDDVSNNMLVAVLEATTIQQTADGKTNYVFGKSGGKEQFFKVRAAGMEVPANNAYLAISDAEAKGLDVIGFGEDATGINAIENADMLNGDIYNLQGQKMNRAQKGVIIVNGKKIVIK